MSWKACCVTRSRRVALHSAPRWTVGGKRNCVDILPKTTQQSEFRCPKHFFRPQRKQERCLHNIYGLHREGHVPKRNFTKSRDTATQRTQLTAPKPVSRKLEVWPGERFDLVVASCCVRRALMQSRLDHPQSASIGATRKVLLIRCFFKPGLDCLYYYRIYLLANKLICLCLFELVMSNRLASCRRARRSPTRNPGSCRESAWVSQWPSGVFTESCGRPCVPRYLDVLM